jgi:hypothetical protein
MVDRQTTRQAYQTNTEPIFTFVLQRDELLTQPTNLSHYHKNNSAYDVASSARPLMYAQTLDCIPLLIVERYIRPTDSPQVIASSQYLGIFRETHIGYTRFSTIIRLERSLLISL